jgi:hypothetical protein
MGTVDNILRRVALVVPENPNLVAAVKGELVTGIGVPEPRAQVLLLCEWFDSRRLVFLVDTSFPAITFDIHQFVNEEGMLLIKGRSVQLLYGGNGLLCGFVLDEGKSATAC